MAAGSPDTITERASRVRGTYARCVRHSMTRSDAAVCRGWLKCVFCINFRTTLRSSEECLSGEGISIAGSHWHVEHVFRTSRRKKGYHPRLRLRTFSCSPYRVRFGSTAAPRRRRRPAKVPIATLTALDYSPGRVRPNLAAPYGAPRTRARPNRALIAVSERLDGKSVAPLLTTLISLVPGRAWPVASRATAATSDIICFSPSSIAAHIATTCARPARRGMRTVRSPRYLRFTSIPLPPR